MEDERLWVLTESRIRRLGISTDYKGYFYLINAVVICVHAGYRKADLYKEVYADIARSNDVSVECVEKCIRRCIEKSWDADKENYSFLHRNAGRRPTNGEVIAFISSCIRLESIGGF